MTPSALATAMGIPQQRAQIWAQPLTVAMARFSLNTPERIAAFIAQIGHESAGLSKLEEDLDYKSAARLCEIWPTRFYDLPDTPVLVDQKTGRIVARDRAFAPHYAGRPIAIGNHVYASRFGNGDEASGDGYNFRARGPTGLTFHDNYLAFGTAIGSDLVSRPDLVLQPDIGALSAGWFWQTHKCNDFVDLDDFEGLTHAINGGLIGLADRQARLAIALNVMRDLSDPSIGVG